jgi:nucleotide-binding universal stress UspA family protein
MSYKTILVHLNDERCVKQVLRVAVPLARRFEAHLIGMHVLPPPFVVADVGFHYASQVIAIERKRLEEQAARIRAVFEDSTRGQPLVADWRQVDAETSDMSRALVEPARAVDLVVAAQLDPDWELSPLFDAPERLVLECGRPVLIVPYAGDHGEIGKRVMVAWNSRREASRAVFDALPLLKTAEQVSILWFNPDKDGVSKRELPTAEIAAALARHGVRATASQSFARDIDVGNELLSRLADESADMLVMGGYGHSRLREMVFGGATRAILKHMTVPVLMSH